MTAGLMGFSNGTEEAWSDGATTGKGLIYGVFTGAWEGAQWAIGAKINQYGGIGDRVASGLFKGAEAGVGTRILMDTVDSGLEGFVQPALTMIYKDYGQGNLIDNYKTAFEGSGGWSNVASQAVMGAIGSAIGEFSGARKLLKESKVSSIDEKELAGAGVGLVTISDEGAERVFKSGLNESPSLKQTFDVDSTIPMKEFSDSADVRSSDILHTESIAENSGARLKQFSIDDSSATVVSVEQAMNDLESYRKANGIFASDSNRVIGAAVQQLIDRVEAARKVQFETEQQSKLNFLKEKKSSFDRSKYEHVSTDVQKKMADRINQSIENNGEAHFVFKSTKQLTSNMLEQVSDLDKLQVRIFGGFADLDGNYKEAYSSLHYKDRVTYSGREALEIVKRIEQLESRIDMSLPPTERAKQIYEIVSGEYSYSHESLKPNNPNNSWVNDRIRYQDGSSNSKGHRITGSLRGITNFNDLGEEGLVCAGYAQLYKELCNRADLQCDYVHGMAITSSGSGRHAWNVVIGSDGETIPVDCTWHHGPNDNWFGNSQQFASTHYAFAHERFTNYGVSTEEGLKTVQNMVQLIENSHAGGNSSSQLLGYMTTGNETFITRKNGARTLASQISAADINAYFDTLPLEQKIYDYVDYVKNGTCAVLGKEDGEMLFSSFLRTGSTSLRTYDGRYLELPSQYNIKSFAKKYITDTDREVYLNMIQGGR